jgi:hypothetical protein
MDWATAAIEAGGLLILGIWIVIPIQEFKQILAKMRREDSNARPTDASPPHP